MEVLSSLLDPTELQNPETELWEFLISPKSKTAREIFWQIGRRGMLESQKRGLSKTFKVHSDAIVVRHWFTTMSEFLTGLSSEVLDDLRIGYVPGPGIAGEWYLGVSADSAALDVATGVLRQLTSKAEELERLRRGVGLPTRNWFYSEGSSFGDCLYGINRIFKFPAKRALNRVNGAFRRSRFSAYEHATSILSDHLSWMLDVAPQKRGTPAAELSSIWNNLVNSVKLVESELRERSGNKSQQN